jgi:ethylmalonyl-CoA mutase
MTKDAPWLFRTYAGHSTAAASNALYRGNLAKGQTGLSVAFDLPTQTGYDSDDPARAGRSARSACRSPTLATCARCFADIPLEQMNTSMTINATAPWLLALYIAVAEEQGADVVQSCRAPCRTTSSRNTCRAGPISCLPNPRFA